MNQKPKRNRRRPANSAIERAEFFRNMNESYAQLKADPEGWAAEQAERELWDSTVADGLDQDS